MPKASAGWIEVADVVKVTALRARGYRNLDTTIGLCDPVAVLVGENNAGKSNVIDALRTVLEPEAGPRARCWLREEDFAHDGHGNRLSDELEIEVQLGGLTKEEQARMVTCLAPASGEGVAKIRLKATIGADGRIQTQWFGGDSQVADVERHARDAARFVYLHPLRDAANDLRPGRDNKLIGLIAALAPSGHPDRQRGSSMPASWQTTRWIRSRRLRMPACMSPSGCAA